MHLVVGVSGDEETIRKKGKIVNTQEERVAIIEHCKWTDEVICPCPWVISIDFLKKHNIHYVAHDDLPYNIGASGASNDIYYDVKKALMFRATQRTEGISTSDVITRIIGDYDMYIERNIDRGLTREEIGVPVVKYYQLIAKKMVNKYAAQYNMSQLLDGVDEKMKFPVLLLAVFVLGMLFATILLSIGFGTIMNIIVMIFVLFASINTAANLGL